MRHTKEQVKNNNQTTQGTSSRNTFGCLVIAKERVKDKNNSDEVDNILGADSSKKEDLAKIIKEVNGLNQYLFDEDTRAKLKSDDARAKAVVKHIEIRIKNNFKQTKAKEQEETLPPNIIRIETEDESEEFIEIIFDESVEEIEKEIENEQEIYEFMGIYSDQMADASDSINQYNALMGNEVKSDIIAIPRFMPRLNPKGSKRPGGRKTLPKAPEYPRNKKDVVKIVRELKKEKSKKMYI